MSAKSRHHGHAKQQVNFIEKGGNIFDRCGGIEGETSQTTSRTNAAQGFRNIVIRLHVHRDQIGSGGDEPGEKMIRT